MPVPGTQEIRRALLEILREGNPQFMTAKKWMTLAEKHLGLTVSMQAQDSADFKDRIIESLEYLAKENMISNPSRNTYMITKKGKNMLEDKTETPDEGLEALPDDLDLSGDDAPAEEPDTSDEELEAQDEKISKPESSEPASEDSGLQSTQQDEDTQNSIDEVEPDMPKDDLPADDVSTTEEDFPGAVSQALNIEDVLERHNAELADKVLMRTAGLSQEMFAVFVTDLLSKMGYNAFQTARYTSESEDSSMIQGVILDPKAKSPIYIHADKLSPGRTVGRSDMHDFAEELAEKGGTGIFATTGEFSEQAGIYAQDERIMLIDGKKLAGLILANNFCVNVAKVFEVKELDEDSFSEYE